MTDTLTDERTDLSTSDGDHDRFAHYVYHPDRKAAAAVVTEAMVTGIPVRAICGKLWVPSRDGSKFPVCPDCKDIRDRALGGQP